MQIEESDEQFENACDSIRESLEPDSNVTLESARHTAKQRSERTSTDDGMQIDESDEQYPNASDSIRENLEPDSNVTLETILFPQKQWQLNSPIPPATTTTLALPKYLTIDVPSKLTKNSSLILKLKFPSSTQTSFRFV
jgi:Arc/MetJ-type ribon-helix-helix transcriptional regulator